MFKAYHLEFYGMQVLNASDMIVEVLKNLTVCEFNITSIVYKNYKFLIDGYSACDMGGEYVTSQGLYKSLNWSQAFTLGCCKIQVLDYPYTERDVALIILAVVVCLLVSGCIIWIARLPKSPHK